MYTKTNIAAIITAFGLCAAAYGVYWYFDIRIPECSEIDLSKALPGEVIYCNSDETNF